MGSVQQNRRRSPFLLATFSFVADCGYVDNFCRESLAVEPGQAFTGEQVAAVLDRVVAERGLPGEIRVDNGTEFTSKTMDLWRTPTK